MSDQGDSIRKPAHDPKIDLYHTTCVCTGNNLHGAYNNSNANVNTNTNIIMRSFSSLPYAVRRRIYTFAGLVRFCPINLNTESANKARYAAKSCEWLRNWADFDGDVFDAAASYKCDYRAKQCDGNVCYPDEDGLDCMCPSIPIALLSVSRAIHDEATTILYSENRFRICKTQPNGLSALLQLSPRAYRHIKSLSIQLNRCCCTPGQECRIEQQPDQYPSTCPYCHDRCRGGRDAPWLLSPNVTALEAREIVSPWNAVVDRLAQYIQSSTLRLSVICDTVNETTARHVMEPLLALPALAACDIRLSQAPYTVQSAIARSMAVQLTGGGDGGDGNGDTSDSGRKYADSFRFLDLPIELQLRILGYSDLVSPSAIELGAACTRPYRLASCCQMCTDTLEACCCAVMHGAYSTSAGSCTCWTMPTPLFLVNHDFYEHSRSIFFSKNVFRIVWYTTEDDEARRRTLSSFLTVVPPSSLPLIRNIHIRLSDLNYAQFESDAAERHYCFRKDWVQSIALLAQELMLSNLNLWIEDASEREPSIDHWETGVDDSLQIEEKEWKLYQRLIQPLVDIGQPLCSFTIKLADPPYGLHDKIRDERRHMLEQRVMGQDYNSSKVVGLQEMLLR